MSSSQAHLLAANDRPLNLRARSDIQSSTVTFAAQTTYVLKDPLTLELLHLTAEEHFLFQSLKHSTTLSKLQKEFQRLFAPRTISIDALQQGVNQLYVEGLLLSESTGQGQELLERGQKRRRNERLQSLFQLLSIRVGSIDATKVVDALYSKVRWLFSVPLLALASAIVCYAAWLLLTNSREFIAQLPGVNELARPENWLLWIVTFVIVKIIHEFAHALTCKHFGGRCHEIGVLLLACVPCLYCDVTDVWRLSNKWQRIAVSAAGMIVELTIAAVALIFWWYTQPGLLHTWCLSLVLVCSITTLMVNANPLLRYDGYYILSDLIEVPNLARRAQRLLPQKLSSWLMAKPTAEETLLSRTQRRGLAIYALTSRIYLTLILLGIFAFLLAWARPYRLENLIYTLGVFTIFGILMRPLMALKKMLANPTQRMRIRRLRATALLATTAALLAAVVYIPIKHSVSGPIVLIPTGGKTVFATAAGELRYAAAAGSKVQKGEIIARFVDPDFELVIARQKGEFEVNRVRYQQLNAMRSVDTRMLEQLPTAQAAMIDAQLQLDEYHQQAENYVLRAPASGTVISPPPVELDTNNQHRLPNWSGSPLESRNLGCWLESGTALCSVADPAQLEALLAIDQTDVPEVRPGQHVRLLLDAIPMQVLEGEVLQVAHRATNRSSEDSSLDQGKYHLVQIRLNSQHPELLVGSRGVAKIQASRTTLGAMITNELRRILKLPW